MIVAQQKRRENIAEHLLYMWQVEDLIRAANLDEENIRRTIVDRYDQSGEVKEAIARWYRELADMMRSEGVSETGHLQINNNILAQLADLHRRLLASPEEQVYGAAFYKTLPFIVQLRAKSGEDTGEIETCFNALYGYISLRMQRREVSAQTAAAMKQIALFLSLLSEKFKAEENGELEI